MCHNKLTAGNNPASFILSLNFFEDVSWPKETSNDEKFELIRIRKM